MKFYCIADEDTVRGFRLGGVEGTVAATAQEAATALQKATKDRQCGIVILTDTVAESIRAQVDAVRFECDRPLIVEIPGPAGPMPSRTSLRRIVQEAVGIRLEPQEG